MSSPSIVPDSDRVARLEQELTRLAEVLKRTERSLGGFQWAFSLLILGIVAAVILVRNGVIDLKQVLNLPTIATKVESKGFDFYNRHDKRVMFVEDEKFGYPGLAFLDLDLNYKMGINMRSDAEGGAPEISFYGKGGTRAQFRLGTQNEALIRLLGEEKKGEILLQITRDGNPSLTMKDASGKVLFRAPEGVSPSLESSESAGRRR